MAIASGPIGFAKLPHVSRRLADETLLFTVDGPMDLPIRLNSSGSQLWNSVEDRTDFSSDEATLINSLVEYGLLVQRSGDAVASATRTMSTPDVPDRQPSPGHATAVGFWQLLRTFDGLAPSGHRSESIEEAAVSVTPGGDVDAFLELVEKHGAVGQLAHAIDLGWINATSAQRHQIQERWAANQLHCLRVERLLVEAARLLDDAAIDFRVLKGVAVAHLDYPDPSYREFGDADILVRSADFDRSIAVLTSPNSALGRRTEIPHPFAKGETLLTRERLMIDVHHQLALGGLGLSQCERFFDEPIPFQLAGHQLRALSQPGRLINVSVHLFAGRDSRSGTLRDFDELNATDSAALARLARISKTSAAVKRTLSQVTPESRLIDALQPTCLERLLAREPASGTYNQRILWREATGLALTSGVTARYDYLRKRLRPSAAFREQRRVDWRTYLAVVSDPIRRRLRDKR